MAMLKRWGGAGIKSAVALLFLLGCARVNIESKKPIKLDVTMRLDIYQHVAKDVTAIEDLISAPKPENAAVLPKTSLLFLGVEEAFAEEEGGYPADVKVAIDARKARRNILVSLESQGVIGENIRGLVEVKDTSSGGEASELVRDENSDRKKIYAYVASKNGVSEEETAKMFAQRIQTDAPQGTPVEQVNGSWVTK